MTRDNKFDSSLVKGKELVKSQSGKWYSLSENDIAIFVAETAKSLQPFIASGETVGLFLDLDNAQFISIVIYNACILCGANVIRCGISDLERQLPVKNNIGVDWMISTSTINKYVGNRITYRNKIIIDRTAVFSINNINSDEPVIYELYDVPGLIVLSNNDIYCPGYDIVQDKKSIVLKKKSSIENTEFSKTRLEGIQIKRSRKLHNNKLITNFIKLYIGIMVKKSLNGEINDDGSIILNSIGLVELLVKIEEEFGISFAIENVSLEKFENIELLSELILTELMEKQ